MPNHIQCHVSICVIYTNSSFDVINLLLLSAILFGLEQMYVDQVMELWLSCYQYSRKFHDLGGVSITHMSS